MMLAFSKALAGLLIAVMNVRSWVPVSFANIGGSALDSMLMRFAKLTPDGRYTPPPPQNAKASYATLVYVRATIVEEAGWYLARSVTIAVRCQKNQSWDNTAWAYASRPLPGI